MAEAQAVFMADPMFQGTLVAEAIGTVCILHHGHDALNLIEPILGQHEPTQMMMLWSKIQKSKMKGQQELKSKSRYLENIILGDVSGM